MSDPILMCPQCGGYIMIKKVNCGIFRHGILKKNGKQINPHASKQQCEQYVKKQLIEGCGKPFRLVPNPQFDPSITHVGPKDKENPKWIAESCDYI